MYPKKIIVVFTKSHPDYVVNLISLLPYLYVYCPNMVSYCHDGTRSVLKLLVTVNFIPSPLILVHPDDRGDAFLRIVGSNESHAASQPKRQHSY
jgi:hypothetical protein